MRRKASLAVLLRSFVEDMRVRRYSEATIVSYRRYVARFVAFCRKTNVTSAEASGRRLAGYQAAAAGGPCTKEKRIVALRCFFAWLARHGHIPHDPARTLDVPRRPRRLPRHALSSSQMEKLQLPDVATTDGLLDRTALEIFHSTGLRRQELLDLELRDVDPAHGVVMVREGKGRRDRVVPIGERALYWLERYVAAAPQAAGPGGDARLFPMSASHLGERVRRYLDAVGVPKGTACHLLRHTMATVMLEHGADVRSIGEILGHARIDTTQLYTRVTISKLREVHAATHPAGRRIQAGA